MQANAERSLGISEVLGGLEEGPDAPPVDGGRCYLAADVGDGLACPVAPEFALAGMTSFDVFSMNCYDRRPACRAPFLPASAALATRWSARSLTWNSIHVQPARARTSSQASFAPCVRTGGAGQGFLARGSAVEPPPARVAARRSCATPFNEKPIRGGLCPCPALKRARRPAVASMTPLHRRRRDGIHACRRRVRRVLSRQPP